MLPILYSFRRCPYAIRARMAMQYANTPVELREIVFRDKPEQMLAASPKGTVPTMILPNAVVLDESEQVMRWALAQHDPEHWLKTPDEPVIAELINANDGSFKTHLDHYKYADRHPEFSRETYRQRGEVFLVRLEQRLRTSPYLLGPDITFADVAIFPFIRQFAYVDKSWFDQAPYPQLQRWLQEFLASDLFTAVMLKYPVWKTGDDVTVFPTVQ